MAYVICAVLTAKEGREEDLAAAMAELVEPSRAEPGCLVYEAHRSTTDPQRFMFYEKWADEAAWKVHTETEHFQAVVPTRVLPNVEGRDRHVYDDVNPR